ncbi:MAG: YjjG family noncanonical pyrimidine nucleotidase [Paludibacteraceae bacterium]
MKHSYKYIFLDLDDTIWDFHANAREALRDVFYNEKLNEHFDDFDGFYRTYSKRNLELWTQYGQGLITKDFLIVERFLHPLLKIGINDPERAKRMNSDFLDILATKTILIPNARELMDFCKTNKLPMTIISNGFVEVQYRKLRNSGIEDYFDHVVLSESAGALKPDPKIFEYALKQNHAEKHEALMIGDSFEADITGAVSSGIDAIYLNLTGKKVELQDRVKEVHDLKEVILYLENNN